MPDLCAGPGRETRRKQRKKDFVCGQEPEFNHMGVGKSIPGTGHGVIITFKGASTEEIIGLGWKRPLKTT